MPKPVTVSRFIPSGEERTVNFVASLFPDCGSRGPIVTRIIKSPAHGELNFASAESFSNYVATNRMHRRAASEVAGVRVVGGCGRKQLFSLRFVSSAKALRRFRFAHPAALCLGHDFVTRRTKASAIVF